MKYLKEIHGVAIDILEDADGVYIVILKGGNIIREAKYPSLKKAVSAHSKITNDLEIFLKEKTTEYIERLYL